MVKITQSKMERSTQEPKGNNTSFAAFGCCRNGTEPTEERSVAICGVGCAMQGSEGKREWQRKARQAEWETVWA